MSFDSDFTHVERELLLELIHESLRVKSHFELFIWLQGRLQFFLPHEALISAWGDFSLGLIYFDITSSKQGLRTNNFNKNDLAPLLKKLYSYWQHKQTPLVLTNSNGFFNAIALNYENKCNPINDMRSAVIHGIQDSRGHHDSLYVLMSTNAIDHSSGKMLEALLPYIDTAIRRVSHLPDQLPDMTNITINDLTNTSKESIKTSAYETLSIREKEIMDWVKKGKTNVEIGLILDISAYTVKNHLQRIFKKLDVLNRAQASSLFEQ